MSDDGEAVIGVRGKDGRARSVTLSVPDAAQRRKLTEPDQLCLGLGFDFWQPALPGHRGCGVARRTGRRGRPAGRRRDRSRSTARRSQLQRAARLHRTQRRRKADAGAAPRRQQRAQARRPSTREAVQEARDRQAAFEPPKTIELTISGRDAAHTDLGAGRVRSARGERGLADDGAAGASSSGACCRAGVAEELSRPDLHRRSIAGDSAHPRVPTTFPRFPGADSAVSLGFLNLLPIPILDGGQIVYQLAEWAKGEPVVRRATWWASRSDRLLLVLLMGVALFNDISGMFGAHP